MRGCRCLGERFWLFYDNYMGNFLICLSVMSRANMRLTWCQRHDAIFTDHVRGYEGRHYFQTCLSFCSRGGGGGGYILSGQVLSGWGVFYTPCQVCPITVEGGEGHLVNVLPPPAGQTRPDLAGGRSEGWRGGSPSQGVLGGWSGPLGQGTHPPLPARSGSTVRVGAMVGIASQC